jgi:hypothetical protein
LLDGKVLIAGSLLFAVPLLLLATITSLSFPSADAHSGTCAVPDEDWPDKPCNAYDIDSEDEIREMWDEYYAIKGNQWMEMKKAEMDQIIEDGLFTEWLRRDPGNWNVYFYYHVNGQAPTMVRNSADGEFFVSEQDPSVFTYYNTTGVYWHTERTPDPLHASQTAIYAMIGAGTAGALATFFAFWKVKLK